MANKEKAARIRFFDLGAFKHTPQMRAFHMTWMAFLFCFFAWFGIAPLMPVIRKEMGLTADQVGWCVIGSVATTIFARLIMGWLCDRIGPRLAYSGLLILGGLPVIGIAFANNFESFLIFRMLIGLIGASFVITQYHTSVMFSPNCVGTANAVAAGLGNSGGGFANMLMPLVAWVFAVSLGLGEFWGWRAAMILAGLVSIVMGVCYFLFTQDSPEGNYADLRKSGKMPGAKQNKGSFMAACRDPRVWALFGIYGACFGVELTIHNIAALHFVDNFKVDPKVAGFAAGAFGVLAIFARGLGGFISDKINMKSGLRGRTIFLGGVLLSEGMALMLFSKMTALPLAVFSLAFFGLFVHMSCGATYAVLPFVNKKALGSVAGIVGAGGNAGAVAAGFLFKSSMPWSQAFFILGLAVVGCSFLVLMVRFSPETEAAVREEMEARLRAEDAALEAVPA